MTAEGYIRRLRVIAGIVAIGLWIASISFSVAGFNFNLSGYSVLGYFLGFSITVIQLVWNREAGSGNVTIMVAGVMAYAYGIYTNVEGIMAAQGLTAFVLDTTIVFPVLLGVFLEVLPEALLVWALTGIANLGDFLGNLAGVDYKKTQQQKRGQQQPSKNGSHNQKNVPQHNGSRPPFVPPAPNMPHNVPIRDHQTQRR